MIRLFASGEMEPNSRWWNSYFPSWMFLKRFSWQASHAPPDAHPHSCPQLPLKGGEPQSRMYIITPRLHKSHLLSYLKSSSVSSMKASTISGAINSALPTGVSSRGVVSEPPPEWNLITEPSLRFEVPVCNSFRVEELQSRGNICDDPCRLLLREKLPSLDVIQQLATRNLLENQVEPVGFFEVLN